MKTKTKSKPKTQRRLGVWWFCETCDNCKTEFTHEGMMSHLKEVHNIDPKTIKGKKSLIMHLDGSDWFSYQWRWEIGGINLLQNSCSKRNKEDQAYWY